MLEILFIIFLFKKLKIRALAKNRSKGLAWLLPSLWLGGEFLGGIIGGIILAVQGKAVDGNLALYGYALLGAVLGAGLAFLIVRLLPVFKLRCPACGWEFIENSKWGLQCNDCGSELKVVEGSVSLVQAIGSGADTIPLEKLPKTESPEEARKHSGIGIASLLTSILTGVLMVIWFVSIIVIVSTTGDLAEDSVAAMVIGLLMILGLFMTVVALGLGIAGLKQENRKKVFPVLGIIISTLILLGTIALMV